MEGYLEHLRRNLGVRPGEDTESCLAELCAETTFDGPSLRRAAQVLSGSSAITDQRCGNGLADWLAANAAARARKFGTYQGVFLTQKGEPRKSLGTKGLHAREPWLDAVLRMEMARVLAGLERVAATVVFGASAALARLSATFLDAYERMKQARGLLDYDDLILTTRDLLHRPGVAPWVLFKLEGGIDHILIDEAQDTNPEQWQVVQALAEEFFAGLGARAPGRTIFAVGDAKQSIFSFQRADPQKFVEMQGYFSKQVTDLALDWRRVR